MKVCKQCGGALEFNPSTQNLKCTKCQGEYGFEKSDEFTRHDFDMEVETVEADFSPDSLSMHCPACGAVFTDEKAGITTTCVYCGANLVAEFKDDKGAPDAVVPYTFDKSQALQKFKEGLKQKYFLPNNLKKGMIDANFESVYIPAYLYNIQTENDYFGRLYDSHTDSHGNSHRSYFKISGRKSVTINDAVIECSSQMTQVALDKIRPFDMTCLNKYSYEFLLGYSVEYYDKKLEETKETLKQIVKNRVRSAILRDYNYDGVDYLNIDTSFRHCDYTRVVLPTYRVKFNYRNKNYVTFMNGQTGKVGGNIPRSKWKIGFLVAGIIAVVAVIACIVALT